MKKYLQQLLTRLETVRLYRCVVLLASYDVFRPTFLSCFGRLLHIYVLNECFPLMYTRTIKCDVIRAILVTFDDQLQSSYGL
jgi:hypothetical protein